MKNSAHDQLTKIIEQIEKGSLVFLSDLRGLAEDTTINMILSRLQKEGKLTRLAHGIYMCPDTTS
jgi:predicted transcriptional regulator of viral defense system